MTELLLYSGFIGQRAFVRILVRRVIGPVEFLLLSEVGQCRFMMGLADQIGAVQIQLTRLEKGLLAWH